MHRVERKASDCSGLEKLCDVVDLLLTFELPLNLSEYHGDP